MSKNEGSTEEPKKKKKKAVIIIIIVLLLIIIIAAAVVVVMMMGGSKGDKNNGNVDVGIDDDPNHGGTKPTPTPGGDDPTPGGDDPTPGGDDPTPGGDDKGEGKLAICLDYTLSNPKQSFQVTVDANYKNVTFKPDSSVKYSKAKIGTSLPDDIARYDGMHSIKDTDGRYTFFSFSFWLTNVGTGPVDVDMRMTYTVDRGANPTDTHIEDAMRFMIIEGETLLSQNTYTIYKSAEKEGEDYLYATPDGINGVMYDRERVADFAYENCVFEKSGENAIKNFAAGDKKKFTVVMWVEGCDKDCVDAITYETLSARLEFAGN